jgi:hypothetical protein
MTVQTKASSNLPETEVVPMPKFLTIKMYRWSGIKTPCILTLALYLNQRKKEHGWWEFSSIRPTLPLLTADLLTVRTNKKLKKQSESPADGRNATIRVATGKGGGNHAERK